MTKFIDCSKQGEEKKKPIEFTHVLDGTVGWEDTDSDPSYYDKIIYLGRCKTDGDMFAADLSGYINIFKGHLNDGFVEQ